MQFSRPLASHFFRISLPRSWKKWKLLAPQAASRKSWLHLCHPKASANFQTWDFKSICYLGMDQYLLMPFLGGWTSIYQLFWCSPGVQGFDTLPYSVVVNVSVTNASASAHLQHVEFFSHCRLGALVLQLNLFDGSLQGTNHLPNPSVVITPVELPMFGFCQTSVGKILSVRVAINWEQNSNRIRITVITVVTSFIASYNCYNCYMMVYSQ